MLQPNRRTVLIAAATTAGTLALGHPPAHAAGPVRLVGGHSPEAAARWLRASYEVVAASGLTPPSAARVYAAVTVAMYEAALGGMPHHRTTEGQLVGLAGLPRPAAAGLVHWPLVVGAAAAATLRGLFAEPSGRMLDVLAQGQARDVDNALRAGVTASQAAASTRHGQAVAHGVLRWIGTDGHADASTLAYVPPVGPSLWVPTPPNFGRAIEPHCAAVRPMLLATTDEVVPSAPLPFSTEPGSPFWQQAEATYLQSRANTDEQRDLARFWTDNPLFSGLPAGHWLSIAVQACEQRGLALDVTLEALARTGVTLHDAFLNCWTHKYRHNLLRPVTYIQRHLDAGWTTWVNTPQFPEHTSGHSVASRAAAAVLTDLLGRFALDDTALATTVGITRRTRRWSDFTDAADSAAQSRLFGGIHFPHGIDAGKDQGDAIGALVLTRLTTRR